MNKWSKRLPDALALILLFIYLSPYIIFPTHAHFLIHDNLDSEIGWYKMIAESGLTFSSNYTVFPNLFNGIPRGCMPSELDFYTLLNLICSPLIAYCLLVVSQHLIAFFGMRLLLKDYIFRGNSPYYTALIALTFALLPFWPLGEYCVAGQPFVIWAIFNLIREKKTIYNWLIVLIFPFCSADFVFSNLFFLPGILLGMIVYFIVYKKVSLIAILAWLVLLGLSALSEYRLFLLQFGSNFSSQRNTYFTDWLLNWKGFVSTDLSMFFKGQYHFYSCQFPIIITTLVISLFLVRTKRHYTVMAILLSLAFLFSSIDTFHFWSGSEFFFKRLGNLSSLQLRFKALIPIIWYLIFAICICFMLERLPKLSILCLLLISAQIILLFFNLNTSDFQKSVYAENAFYYTYFDNTNIDHRSFKNYFAPKMFSDAKEKINYNNETVLCLGFPAEIAQYSGFHSASAYLDYYPAEKKKQIIDIFRPELMKVDDSLKIKEIIGARRFQYFYKRKIDTLKKMLVIDLDTLALKKMNIKYVLSLSDIENTTQLHLKPIDSFSNENKVFPEQIYIYKVN